MGNRVKMRWVREQAGPLIIAGIAATILIAAFLQPRSKIDLGPAALGANASASASFSPAYSGWYEIDLQMDEKTAERLFPCTADPDAFQKANCREKHPQVWPVSLAFTLHANEKDLTGKMSMPPRGPGANSDAGGSYGDNLFFWTATEVPLEKGVSYQLTTLSLRDGTVLSATHPRLVALSMVDLFDTDRGLGIVFAGCISIMLAVGAVVWAALRLARRKKLQAR